MLLIFLCIVFLMQISDPIHSLICDEKAAEDLNFNEFKMASRPSSLLSLEFEVYGKVQGVFFRKYTSAKAKELTLRGWCRNTSQGTVLGIMEGPSEQINKMKHWLQTEGSPKSRISRAEFRKEQKIPNFTCSTFDIKK